MRYDAVSIQLRFRPEQVAIGAGFSSRREFIIMIWPFQITLKVDY